MKTPSCSEKKTDAVPALSPISPLPENFVADSPMSRWELWRRQTGLRLCNTAVQTSPKPLLPKRSLTPFRFVEKADAAVQTTADDGDDAPLTLKHLKDELKAFAIAFGF